MSFQNICRHIRGDLVNQIRCRFRDSSQPRMEWNFFEARWCYSRAALPKYTSCFGSSQPASSTFKIMSWTYYNYHQWVIITLVQPHLCSSSVQCSSSQIWVVADAPDDCVGELVLAGEKHEGGSPVQHPAALQLVCAGPDGGAGHHLQFRCIIYKQSHLNAH